MANTFAFVGEESIGDYVAAALQGRGLHRVEDTGQADIAFTYCLTSSALEDAYFDEKGLVAAARKGAVLVDLSPSTPSFARELSAVASVNDQVFVEAPLAVIDPLYPGAVPVADNLTCFVACEENVPADVLDLLEDLAGTVTQVGAVGTAQLAKAMHTIQTVAQVVSAVESRALVDSVREGANSMGSFSGDDYAIGSIARSTLVSITDELFGDGLSVALMMGDVVAAMSSADDVDLILPQLEAAMHLLELLAVIGGSDKGPAALALLYREEAVSAAQGLDWTRAEGLYEGYLANSEHEGAGDDFGFAGGISGYSAN